MYSVKNKSEKIETVLQNNGNCRAEVTVLIPVYNYEEYVLSALDSVKAQTIDLIDIVVVDDCSTDDSCRVAKEWLHTNKHRFNNSKLIHNKKNIGLARTRNLAVTMVETEYLLPLDADNILYPRCLETLISGIKNSGASFAYCYLEQFGDIQAIGGLEPWDVSKLKNGNTIDGMVLHRSDILLRVEGYSEDMPGPGWEDYELWFKIAKIDGWGIRVPEILARYRVHVDSMLFTETDVFEGLLRNYLKKKHPKYF